MKEKMCGSEKEAYFPFPNRKYWTKCSTIGAKGGGDDDDRTGGVGMAEFLLAVEHNEEQDKGDQLAQDKGGKLEQWPWLNKKKMYSWMVEGNWDDEFHHWELPCKRLMSII